MKNFTKMSMVLFDSTNAHFKLSVETIFTKFNATGGFSPLVYIGQSGIANLNPNIYLMFTYKSDTYDKGNYLYTSYPQIYRIREAMNKVKNLICDGTAFTKDENGMLMVKPEYKTPIVLTNIGKQNKWLSFTPLITNSVEEGVSSTIPGVSLEISSTNGYASVLTVEEFLTLYTIINDLNLANLQAMMSIAFLNCDNFPAPVSQHAYNNYHAAPQGGYQQPRQNYANSTQSYTGTGRQQYQLTGGQYQQYPTQKFSTPAHQQYQQQPLQQQNNSNNNSNHLPPRPQEKQPVMNFKAVDETKINYDDEAALDEIFNDNN